jgi:hypothetical protein
MCRELLFGRRLGTGNDARDVGILDQLGVLGTLTLLPLALSAAVGLLLLLTLPG